MSTIEALESLRIELATIEDTGVIPPETAGIVSNMLDDVESEINERFKLKTVEDVMSEAFWDCLTAIENNDHKPVHIPSFMHKYACQIRRMYNRGGY